MGQWMGGFGVFPTMEVEYQLLGEYMFLVLHSSQHSL